jgi:PIN domain nuclease of toxin-antitoxin system
MRVLLDTHALLWWLSRDKRLTQAASDAIANASFAAASAVSAYEIALKARQGKLTVPRVLIEDFTATVDARDLTVLAIQGNHAAIAGDFPLAHRDPFDRLLSAQALAEGLTLVSCDRGHEAFRVPVLW